MSWLRVDDGFAQHPKLVQLTPKDRWTWMEVLCYCARYQTEGRVPAGVREVIRGATIQFLRRCEELRLLDADGDQFRVHDWQTYNPKDPKAADRMRRVRERAPQPVGGQWERARAAVFERDQGICVDCGKYDEGWNADHEPPRAVLIERGESIYDLAFIYTRCHSCHAKKTRRESANNHRTNSERNSEHISNSSVPSRAGARARPVPSPKNPPSFLPSVLQDPGDGRTDDELEELAELTRLRESTLEGMPE